MMTRRELFSWLRRGTPASAGEPARTQRGARRGGQPAGSPIGPDAGPSAGPDAGPPAGPPVDAPAPLPIAVPVLAPVWLADDQPFSLDGFYAARAEARRR